MARTSAKNVARSTKATSQQLQSIGGEPMMRAFWNDERGQDLVEYALLLVFLALAAISILPILGQTVNNTFSSAASSLNAPSGK